MGGFAMGNSVAESHFLPAGRTRMILTLDGLRYLARKDSSLVPDLSRAQIEDKSKASNFAKTLVCLQASWFCIQCLSRFGQRLPISLLEINTFAHALCTLIIYLMWWNKPQDIEEPSLVQGEGARELCALMCMSSNIGRVRLCQGAPSGKLGSVFLEHWDTVAPALRDRLLLSRYGRGILPRGVERTEQDWATEFKKRSKNLPVLADTE